MSLIDSLDEHQRMLTVVTLFNLGFLTLNVLSADLNKHPVRDPLLCAAFAYAAYRSSRYMFTNATFTLNAMAQDPKPAEQLSYHSGMFRAIAPLPGAMSVYFAALAAPSKPLMAASLVTLGGVSAATYLYGRRLQKQAALE